MSMNPSRATMSSLISKVRQLINDPSGTGAQFDDGTVQDALDDWRQDVRYEQLTPASTLANTGTQENPGTADYNWTDYYSAFKWWEQGEVLTDGHFLTLTPASSDELQGHWTFNLPAPGQYPPVFIVGHVYDVYAAAADLLDMWSAMLLSSVDVTSDGQSFHLSQLSAGKQKLACIYRRRMLPTSAKQVRRDVNTPDTASEVVLLGNNDDIITR